jgi:hypothetical protein
MFEQTPNLHKRILSIVYINISITSRFFFFFFSTYCIYFISYVPWYVYTYTRCKCLLCVYWCITVSFVCSQAPCVCARTRAPIKIMLKMCSSSLQRKTSRLYRCKRKKENQGPRRKYERNNMPGALEVADVSAISIRTKLCRACR